MVSRQKAGAGFKNLLLAEDISKLYLDTDTTDVRFLFREKNKRKQIPAHKILLAARSDVFKAMFYGSLKEDGDVTIVDTSMAAFEEFLQFFYVTDVKLTMENVTDVINLMKKYNVGSMDICESFLIQNVTADNLCFVYNLAILFDLGEEVKKKCELVISSHTKQMFSSTDFRECSPTTLGHIMKSSTFNCQEVDTFHACIEWVKTRSNQEKVSKKTVQDHLGDLFYQIRFKSMSLEDFADLTPDYGKLFSLEEYQDIVQMIRLKYFESSMFNNSLRRRYHQNTLTFY